MTDLNGCTAGTVAEAANGEERVMGRPAAVTGDQPYHAIPAGDGDGDDDSAECASASVHTNRIGPSLPPPLPPPPRGAH